MLKRKPLRILDLLCDNERIDAAQCFYLPVNVQHLRLEKAGAITRDNPFAHTISAQFRYGLWPCPSQIALETTSLPFGIVAANVFFNSAIPSPFAADAGMILVLGDLYRDVLRSFSSSGKSMLL